MITLLIILLVIALFAGLPSVNFGYNNGGGYGPSGGIGLVLLILVILLVLGRI